MDIWAPVLPPVESYWENAIKVIYDHYPFHKAFFSPFIKNNLCMEPEMAKKVKKKIK